MSACTWPDSTSRACAMTGGARPGPTRTGSRGRTGLSPRTTCSGRARGMTRDGSYAKGKGVERRAEGKLPCAPDRCAVRAHSERLQRLRHGKGHGCTEQISHYSHRCSRHANGEPECADSLVDVSASHATARPKLRICCRDLWQRLVAPQGLELACTTSAFVQRDGVAEAFDGVLAPVGFDVVLAGRHMPHRFGDGDLARASSRGVASVMVKAARSRQAGRRRRNSSSGGFTRSECVRLAAWAAPGMRTTPEQPGSPAAIASARSMVSAPSSSP